MTMRNYWLEQRAEKRLLDAEHPTKLGSETLRRRSAECFKMKMMWTRVEFNDGHIEIRGNDGTTYLYVCKKEEIKS
jgi:hypothetical protein